MIRIRNTYLNPEDFSFQVRQEFEGEMEVIATSLHNPETKVCFTGRDAHDLIQFLDFRSTDVSAQMQSMRELDTAAANRNRHTDLPF